MATSSRSFLRFAALIVALVAAGAQAIQPADEAAPHLSAGRPGLIVDAPSGSGEAELLTFDDRLASSLIALAPEESLRIADWPVSPGIRRTVVLTRHEIYAPDARIVMMDDEHEVELPRSKLVFFWGSFEGGNVVVAVDPDARVLSGLVMTGSGVQELHPPDANHPGRHLLAASDALREKGAPPPTWSCGEEELGPPPASSPAPSASETREALAGRMTLAPFTKYAVVAIDTDNELMLNKFGNNTTPATNYIANLFAAMNVIYERDVHLHLLQGYTILRVSTTTDPYTPTGTPSGTCTAGGGNADCPRLVEFSNYWGSHYGNVRRMATMMLSGKQTSAWSASGIAWLSGLCSTGTGYSFNQVFMFAQDTSSNDVFITAHELGHNLSSPHTHCYANPAPDRCYNRESCYTGATSCPASATYNGVTTTGTLMSYCHVPAASGGVDGCAAGLVFHPLTLSRYLNPGIAGASACIFSGSSVPTGPAVTGISPPTGALAGATPVTITGSGFVSGAAVAFVDLNGSTPLTSVSFVNSGTLTGTTPSHAAGAVDVVVFNPDQQTGTLRNGFTYTTAPPPPTVSGINPNNGSTLGSTPVTITGTGFVAGATVTIGGVSAAVGTVSATSIAATTGAHATGTVGVTVTNPDSQANTLTNAYFYVPPPAGAKFYTLTPCRIVDTRNTTGPLGGPALQPNATRLFTVANTCGVPVSAVAISVNVTGLAAGSGYFTLFFGNGLNPGTSNLSFSAGQTRANNAVLYLSTDGTGGVKVLNGSAGANHFILDVNGYFQ